MVVSYLVVVLVLVVLWIFGLIFLENVGIFLCSFRTGRSCGFSGLGCRGGSYGGFGFLFVGWGAQSTIKVAVTGTDLTISMRSSGTSSPSPYSTASSHPYYFSG